MMTDKIYEKYNAELKKAKPNRITLALYEAWFKKLAYNGFIANLHKAVDHK